MKTTQSSGRRPVHQTVAGEFEVKSGGKSIAIGFTKSAVESARGQRDLLELVAAARMLDVPG